MSDSRPVIPDQKKADADHLRLLSIFHFVMASFAVLGLGFLFLHYLFLHHFIANPEMWKNQKGNGPPPQEFFAIFKWAYIAIGTLVVTAGLANLLSGWFIRRRTYRIFSLVVAGLNCLQFPFGTALGVFTFVVLLRDSVRELYEVKNRNGG